MSVGAQVSYDDRENFGRVARDVPYDVLREQVADQVGTLSAIAAAAGTSVRYVKPHGALYHRVLDDEEQARGGARRVRSTCRCSACRARCLRAAPRRPGGRCTTRASRTAGTAPTGGCCRATEPGAVLDGRRRDRRPGARAGRRASTRCACTATARARSTTRAPYAGRSRPPAGRCGASEELSLAESPDRRPGRRAVPPQPVESTCGERREPVDVPRSPVEQTVGPEECRTFFGRTPCAASDAGRRTLPPIHQRPSRKAEPQGDRGSDRSEDPHREATRGVGPVTGTAGSESRSGRGGRHPASSAEGLLVLIPSRGPHLASAPGRPCRSRSGDRVPAGLPDGARVSSLPTVLPWGSRDTRARPHLAELRRRWHGPGSQPVRRRRCGTRTATKLHTAGQLAASTR